MTVLFILSNIAVPFIVLAYTTLAKVYRNGQFSSPKWLLMILYTLLSNILFYFLQDDKLFLIIDLVIKLAIVFLPTAITYSIQRMLVSLHFQKLINFIRCFFIQQIYLFTSLVLLFFMRRMNKEQQRQFKIAISNTLQRQAAAKLVSESILQQYKKYQNIGVGCDLLTISMLNDQKRQNQLLKLQLHQAKVELGNSKITNYSSTGNLTNKQNRFKPQPLPIVVSSGTGMKKKQTFSIQKSNTDIGIYDEDEKIALSRERNSPIRNRHKSPDVRGSKVQESQPSMILNKLDVSQYSDMFEENQMEQERKPIAKVETIIQIAGMGTARLQIYNIQLYQNSQIRILSLYGRLFQRHRLISIKPLKHGYYELRLQGGKVDCRKVKFRGSFQQFLKYLQPSK